MSKTCIVIARTLAVLGSVSSLTSVASAAPALRLEEHWHDTIRWKATANAATEIASPGHARLSSSNASTAAVFRQDLDVPSDYQFQARIRVEQSGLEQGVAVYDGEYRMMLYIDAREIKVMTVGGLESVYRGSSHDEAWNDYRVAVSEGSASLYLNNRFIATWSMQRDARADEVTFFASDDSRMLIDYTDLSPVGEIVRESVAWESLTDWAISGTGAVDVHSEDGLVLSANDTTPTIIERGLPSLSTYELQFEARVSEFGVEQGVVVYDGSDRTMLYVTDGQRHVQSEIDDGGRRSTYLSFPSSDDAQGWHEYRVVVERRVARLWVDGVFRSEWTVQSRPEQPRIQLFVRGPNRSELRVRNLSFRPYERRRYGHFDNFEDETLNSNPDFWMETNSSRTSAGDVARITQTGHGAAYQLDGVQSGSSLSLLHCLARDASLTMRFKVGQSISMGSKLYFNIRRNHEESRVVLEYDFDAEVWRLVERESIDTPAAVLDSRSAPLALDQWHTATIHASDSHVSLVVDGRLALLATNVSVLNHGRLGVQVKHAEVLIDDVSYVGDRPCVEGIHKRLLGDPAPEGLTTKEAELVEYEGRLRLFSGENGSTCYVSSDDGHSWTVSNDWFCADSWRNMVSLPNGEVMSIKRSRVGTSNTTGSALYQHVASVSDTTAQDWGRNRSFVESSGVPGLIVMPGKLSKTSRGRLFFPSSASRGLTDGPEHEDIQIQIHYSDDHGQTWSRSRTAHDFETFGLNLQEGQVVETDAGDGTGSTRLKAFFRVGSIGCSGQLGNTKQYDKLGYLYESVSLDGGDTWETPQPSVFRSTMTAFNVERDPVTGFHYMLWEYTQPSAYCSPGHPRTRTALAVSYDGTESWEFVTVLDEWAGNVARHANHNLRITNDHLWALVPRKEHNQTPFVTPFKLRVWRIAKSSLTSSP
ncbi:MAG: sialidase family protein, partial [Myxococcota bacterium]